VYRYLYPQNQPKYTFHGVKMTSERLFNCFIPPPKKKKLLYPQNKFLATPLILHATLDVRKFLCISKRLEPNKDLDEIPVFELRGVICQRYLLPDTSERAPPSTPVSKLVLDLPTPEGWEAKFT